MTTFGTKSAGDVFVVIPQARIVATAHCRISVTAPRTVVAADKPVTANAAALELWAAAGRVGMAFGSTGLPVQFPLPRRWPSPVRVGRVIGQSPRHAVMSSEGCVSISSRSSAGTKSDAACRLDAAREFVGPVQKVERRETVGTVMALSPGLRPADIGLPEHQLAEVDVARRIRCDLPNRSHVMSSATGGREPFSQP